MTSSLTAAGPAKIAPKPAGLSPWLPLQGYTPATRIDRLIRDRNVYGDHVRYPMGPVAVHHLHGLEEMRRVLQENADNYIKGPVLQKSKVFLGNGLLTSEGDFWRRQRKLSQPAFHRERLRSIARTVTNVADEVLATWGSDAASGAPFDVGERLLSLSLQIVCQSLFSSDIRSDTTRFAEAVTIAIAEANRRATGVVDLPLAVPTPANRRYVAACKTLDDVVYPMIARRRAASGGDGKPPSQDVGGDLLSMLMAARDADTGESMTDVQLRDEVVTILTAGHDTSARAMAWTVYLLSRHPDVARRFAAEVDAVLEGRVPTIDDVPKLSYVRATIEESMRLYPPIWGLARIALADDVVGGYLVPAKSVVTIFPYTVHRDPRFWSNPEGFDPERFLNVPPGRPKLSYLPFGGGVRICIGNTFALMEATLVLAMLSQRYRLDLAPGAYVDPNVFLSPKPSFGVPMIASARARS